MPNWCSNTVIFEGKTEDIKALLMSVYAELKTRPDKSYGFKLNEGNEMYCFSCVCENLELNELNSETINAFDDTVLYLQYDSRWSPNLKDTRSVAKLFNLDLTHGYEELAMAIYGEAKYCVETDTYSERNLTDDDVAKCSDEEGISDFEKLEEMLNEKEFIEINV
jgi:hypothetical protein